MRDPKLAEELRRLSAEAATRFTSLVATGEEMPFDVAESEGEHTFHCYVPLTARFVRDHADELRSLPAFGPACSAIDSSGVAAGYLEARGEPVPADQVERADAMLVTFIARLWDGSSEFRLDKPRLEAALHELEAEVQDVSEAEVLLSPLVGLQMPLARLDLPGGIQIVRADTVQAPAEVTRSEGMHRSAWEPQFLAFAEKEEGPAGAAPAMRMLKELVSVLRLFKEGGVGLGPFAYTPTGEGTWRRIATGVPETRLGGYKLSEAEASELAEFAQRLEARPDPDGSLAWAVARFEMGCDRPNALDGLSDHLLAMRALFEGSGPVGANLPMRVAALIAEPAERPEAYEKLQAAFELERAMMTSRDYDLGSAMGLAAWAEDAARSIVRGAALGEHGSDVAASADETLVASGLEGGEGSVEQMGSDDEWDPPTGEEPVEEPSEELELPTATELEEPAEFDAEDIRIRSTRDALTETDSTEDAEEPYAGDPVEEPETYEDGIYYEADEDETVSELPGPEQGGQHPTAPGSAAGEAAGIDSDSDHFDEEGTVKAATQPDWLSEVDEGDQTMEWPAVRARSPEDADWSPAESDEEPLEEPRVRHLFPVPDDTDWEVGELDYDRSKTRVS